MPPGSVCTDHVLSSRAAPQISVWGAELAASTHGLGSPPVPARHRGTRWDTSSLSGTSCVSSSRVPCEGEHHGTF